MWTVTLLSCGALLIVNGCHCAAQRHTSGTRIREHNLNYKATSSNYNEMNWSSGYLDFAELGAKQEDVLALRAQFTINTYKIETQLAIER